MATKEFETDAIIPPGESLAEELEIRGITPAEFAKQLGVPPKMLAGILTGEKALTAEFALKMEHALGVSARLWLNMEAGYRLALARKKVAKSA